MHPSVWVDPDHRHLLQAGDRIHPRSQLRQEGVDLPAQALFRREGPPFLADGLGVIREDRSKRGQDFPGT